MSMQPLPLPHRCQRGANPRIEKEYPECVCPNKSCLASCKLWNELTPDEKNEQALIYRVTVLSQYVPYPVAPETERKKVAEIFERYKKERSL